jgi:hypothetical protein
MCLLDLDHNPATRSYRNLFVLGSLCLALALTSQSLNLAFGLPTAPLHFLRGFLIGVSIALNYGALIAARRARSITGVSPRRSL